MSDILPFTQDTLGQVGPTYIDIKKKPAKETARSGISMLPPARAGDGETTSLSFDQVNDDADELIELRGGGRYFGVTDPSTGDSINAQQSLGPLCGNCHERGHIRSKCKTVVCHKCGVVGDHYETQCPTTIKCAKCGEKGHLTSMCTSKTRKRTYCKSCDTFNHDDSSCPSIWRSYITKAVPLKDGEQESDEESSVLPIIYCYNCASQDHYGDECTEYRVSRIPNFGSAFSGSNLPKSMRPFYFHKLKASKRDRSDSYYGKGSQNASSRASNGGVSKPSHNSKKGDYKPNNSGQLPPKKKSFDNFNSYKDNFSSRDFNNRDFSSSRNFSSGGNSSNDNSQKSSGSINAGISYNDNNNYSNNKNYGNNGNNNKSYMNKTNSGSYNNKPTNSGIINSGKGYPKSTSNGNSRPARPTRTGFIEDLGGKKKKSKNIRNLY